MFFHLHIIIKIVFQIQVHTSTNGPELQYPEPARESEPEPARESEPEPSSSCS